MPDDSAVCTHWLWHVQHFWLEVCILAQDANKSDTDLRSMQQPTQIECGSACRSTGVCQMTNRSDAVSSSSSSHRNREPKVEQTLKLSCDWFKPKSSWWRICDFFRVLRFEFHCEKWIQLKQWKSMLWRSSISNSSNRANCCGNAKVIRNRTFMWSTIKVANVSEIDWSWKVIVMNQMNRSFVSSAFATVSSISIWFWLRYNGHRSWRDFGFATRCTKYAFLAQEIGRWRAHIFGQIWWRRWRFSSE